MGPTSAGDLAQPGGLGATPGGDFLAVLGLEASRRRERVCHARVAAPAQLARCSRDDGLGTAFLPAKSRGALWAGALWAINPFLIWHSQDVRNYAIWAAFSPLALWLFWCALTSNRWRDWALYGVAQVAASYTFLLEPFFLLVQLSFALLFFRRRAVLGRMARTWLAMSLALLPLLVQLTRLAGSGYSGTAARVSVETLLRRFLPTLLFGEGGLSLLAGAALMMALLLGLLAGGRRRAPQRVLLLLWLFLPLALLMLFGTQMNIFRPRYVIAVTPALLLSILWVANRARGPWLGQGCRWCCWRWGCSRCMRTFMKTHPRPRIGAAWRHFWMSVPARTAR
ncbi:MAG: hypothetical protein HC915_01015 [Anaerolineae bacterium]|nr:hypothetical protein [Anaerolineae bacterium]